jgi:hypothetical protein
MVTARLAVIVIVGIVAVAMAVVVVANILKAFRIS